MGEHLTRLTSENTNAVAHRVAGDSLVYECPNCPYGDVLLTALIEDDDAQCLDCGTRYRLHIEEIREDVNAQNGEVAERVE